MGGVVLAITVIVVGSIGVGGRMDHHESFWDEHLTSDLEWRFVEPIPKASSMPPVLPRGPPTPFVTVRDLQSHQSMPDIDHIVPDSLPSSSMIGSDPLPIPEHKPHIPSSLQSVGMIVHDSSADSSEKSPADISVRPPMPTFHVESAKRIQSGPQPIQPKKRTRRADLLRVRQPSSNSTLIQMFVSLLSLLGESSKVFTDLHESPNFAEHASRLLGKFAASTVLKYCSTALHFFKLLSSLGYLLETISVVQMADILLTSSLSRSSDAGASGGRATIKALRWLSKIAMVEFLQTLMYHQVINAFVVAKHTRDQQETAPFSLWIIMQFERRILQRNTPDWEVAFLGAVLACVYGGLRFADAQRLPFRSFVLDARTFRGVCDRTKTSHKGQPWGLLNCGLLSKGQFTLVSKYLMTLDEIWAKSNLDSIDFLFFSIDDTSLSPMSYAEALRTLRTLISCPWKSETPTGISGINFTMHSMKSTLLAWAIQVQGISEDMRLVQGHHRGRTSLKVYSRDDVFLQLQLQRILIEAIQKGFRPQMAQHRGSQSPLVEPHVDLELYSKAWQQPVWKMFNFFAKSDSLVIPDPIAKIAIDIDAEESDASSDSSACSSSDSDGEIEADPTPTMKLTPNIPDVAVLGHCKAVQHAMILTPDTSYPMFDRRHFKAACGVFLNPDTCTVTEEVLPQLNLCQRPACRKLWSKMA